VQEASVELPAAENELAGHVRQVAAALAPTVVEYVFAAQSVHAPLPVAILYLPATQSVHAALPVAILYLPKTQAVHVPPSGPVKPMLHVQLVEVVDPLYNVPEFVGQVVQPPEPAPEYVPAPQVPQLPQPAPEYVPAPQVGQPPQPASEYVPAPQVAQPPQPAPE